MTLTVETAIETDGRWIADVLEIPGVLAYGRTRFEAIRAVQRLAAEVVGRPRDFTWRIVAWMGPA